MDSALDFGAGKLNTCHGWGLSLTQQGWPIGRMESNTQRPSGLGADDVTQARAGHVLRDVRVSVRRISCDGNSDLTQDSGSVLRAADQVWTSGRPMSMLFEGLFRVPVLNVELRLSEPLNAPARMTLTAEADNGMLFSREFTFPAGRLTRTVHQVECNRATGGVFDFAGSMTWTISSCDVHVEVDGQRQTEHNMYFLPRWQEITPPLDTVLYVVCRALRGLHMGHEDVVERLWTVFEGLSVPCADGTLLVYTADEHGGDARTVRDLLKRKSGSCHAWVDFFQACLRTGGACRPVPPPAGADARANAEAWPWTVDPCELKLRLLEAKCRSLSRGHAGE
jgi:hypothetical protein